MPESSDSGGSADEYLDRGTLQQLIDLDDDHSFVREVFSAFFMDAEAHVAKLDRDPESRRAAAHTLKGSARQVGAMPVANLCEQLEQVEQSEVAPLVRQLQKALSATRRAADRLLSVDGYA